MNLTGLARTDVASLGLGKGVIDAALPRLIQKYFLVFAKLELGIEVANPQKEWWRLLKQKEDTCILAPRDHGKSYSIIRAYAIWKAKYDPWVNEIMILGADAPSAIENLDKLKVMLASSTSLRDLLPTDRKNVNARSEIKLTNGVVIKAKGFLSTLRGRHPQLILLDDVVNEVNSTSSEGRKKVREYFWGVCYPMKDKGTAALREEGYKPQIVVVGTAQNEDDLYHELLTNPSFIGLRQSAIVDEEKKTVLWPERYSWASLMAIKESMGSLQFSKEYCNEPLTDDTSLFPPALFDPMLDWGRSYVNEYHGSNRTHMGVDFSVPGEQGGDFTAAVVGEALSNGNIVLLHIWRAKPETMKEQVDKIANLSTSMKLTSGLLEANMFQRVFAEHFKKHTNLPLTGTVVSHSGKMSFDTGVLSFRPLFENCKFIFPYKTPTDREITDNLIREFAGLVRKDGKLGNFRFHDDVVMAMWHMLNASRVVPFTFEF